METRSAAAGRSAIRTLLLLLPALACAQDALRLNEPEIRLWPTSVDGAEKWNPSTDGFHRVTNIHNPSITVFLPPRERANGAAFIICPGGAHRYLVMDLEGSLVAKRLNEWGVAAFILKSRLARAPDSKYRVEVESLQDAQRAIRMVRSRAREWNLDPARVGIMGFSAGGALAALAETRFDNGKAEAADPVERQSSRPDFVVLGYGALTSPDMTPTKETPPTFMVVASDDNLAPATAAFYTKLRSAGVLVEAHEYLKGGHGFGMTGRTPEFRNLPLATWPDRLHDWMEELGYLRH